MLADALAIWRGPAFADFGDEEFSQPAIQRLEEQRLVALEDQVEVRLELGEHRELVGELGDLVARYPQRERLLAAHLRALTVPDGRAMHSPAMSRCATASPKNSD